MPSGYTAALYDGEQDFKDFVLTTARGMGALIHMRDSSFDSEITMPEVSTYHRERLQESQDALAAFEAYDFDDWKAARDAEYEESLARWEEIEEVYQARRARYEDMLDKVWSWHPPTNDHVSFKQYMVDQLIESKKFDCTSFPRPERKTVEDYKDAKMARALRDVSYHSEQLNNEITRVNERRKWIQQLLDSLPDE